ncbi:type II secretion system F family protein [Arthrobacter sp. MPF02]|uniref:type II secretion system F family protein n=1 Tax=Arthrobacter sp. MPF02 TaxID=3388492 RepID=UPI003984CD8C
MSAMAWLLIALIIIPVSALAWALIVVDRGGLAAVRSNLGRVRAVKAATPVAGVGRLHKLGARLTPTGYAGWLDELLAKAGRPTRLPLERVLIAKPALALIAGLISVLLATKSPTGLLLLITVALPVVAYFVPDIIIHSRAAERQKVIEVELANTLDQMLISVEAGLGFEAALARSARNGTGPLAEELGRTLQDLQVGRTRKEAYLALAQRSDVPDLRNFVRAVVQADAYGIPLAGVLHTQAKQMRLKRRQRAEEKAMKLPIKVLFPLMFCILPALFLVIMGPAVINVMDNLIGTM